MKTARAFAQCLLVTGCLGLALPAAAAVVQARGSTSVGPSPVAAADGGFGVLLGRWVRPDGGYVIEIRGVDASGKLDASYANPRLLPFARAEAVRDGETIGVYLELRAAGYDGSNYTLAYDKANDRLAGVYNQLVAKQKFDVYFTRAR